MCQPHHAPDTTTGQAAESLSLQTMLDLLVHEYRRELLQHFKELDQTTSSFEAAADRILDQYDAEIGESHDSDSITASLLHVHLPKFEAAGVIEFDQRSHTIRYHDDEQLEALNECLRTFQSE